MWWRWALLVLGWRPPAGGWPVKKHGRNDKLESGDRATGGNNYRFLLARRERSCRNDKMLGVEEAPPRFDRLRPLGADWNVEKNARSGWGRRGGTYVWRGAASAPPRRSGGYCRALGPWERLSRRPGTWCRKLWVLRSSPPAPSRFASWPRARWYPKS